MQVVLILEKQQSMFLLTHFCIESIFGETQMYTQ